MDMNYRGICGREGEGRLEWSEGGEWDNCNSIINKYFFFKKPDLQENLAPPMCSQAWQRQPQSMIAYSFEQAAEGPMWTTSDIGLYELQTTEEQCPKGNLIRQALNSSEMNSALFFFIIFMRFYFSYF